MPCSRKCKPVINRRTLNIRSGRAASNIDMVSGGLDNAADEGKELGRAQDGKGDWRGLDQVLLCDLGPQIAAVGQPVGADDRQGDVMADARRAIGGEQVRPGRLEEGHRLVVEGGRVGDVHDDLGAGQGVREALAGEGVDAGIERGGDGVVALRLQVGDDARTDAAGPSDDDDLHRDPPWLMSPGTLGVERGARHSLKEWRWRSPAMRLNSPSPAEGWWWAVAFGRASASRRGSRPSSLYPWRAHLRPKH